MSLEELATLSQVDGEVARSPELAFPARLSNGMNELPVVGKGIIPDEFLRIFP